MHLLYITRVNVPSSSAQSIQVSNMAKAFAHELGSRFRIVCGGTAEVERSIARIRLPFRKESLRYAFACIAGGLWWLDGRDTVVYTRDIAVAFVVAMTGGKAVYEAHKELIGTVAKLLLLILKRISRFKMVVISNALASWYLEHYQINPHNLLVAHSGAWPEDYRVLRSISKNEMRRMLGLPVSQTVVVHTGSLYPGRGAELFEEVIRMHSDILFVQVGGNADDISRWREYYDRRGYTNISFIDRQPVDRVRAYQVAADLLFYMITRQTPTYWCCSPLKLFEYMASGTPILGARIGSVSEIIDDSCAFCFDPADPETVGKQFESFLCARNAAEQKALVALQSVEGNYSWDNRAARVISTFCTDW